MKASAHHNLEKLGVLDYREQGILPSTRSLPPRQVSSVVDWTVIFPNVVAPKEEQQNLVHLHLRLFPEHQYV